ncbi:MAG: hypothetical protein J2P36_39520, partial [Ktedonobacteraceae bacterium]|nr:hypothetical protein [Ktedonobacteraceae bacterium]
SGPLVQTANDASASGAARPGRLQGSPRVYELRSSDARKGSPFTAAPEADATLHRPFTTLHRYVGSRLRPVGEAL